MQWSFVFFMNSILLGVGLAMDAFSVSIANALGEPGMRKRRMCAIAGVYGIFQTVMPLTGWICVHTIIRIFSAFEKFIPWIALILLLYIGGKMVIEGFRSRGEEAAACVTLGAGALLIQGVATSIDALSVGFTIAEYRWPMALACALLCGLVTFAICLVGLLIGKAFGSKLSTKATILGGFILIGIGIEIFISGVFA